MRRVVYVIIKCASAILLITFACGLLSMVMGAITGMEPDNIFDLIPDWIMRAWITVGLISVCIIFILWFFMAADCIKKIRSGGFQKSNAIKWLVFLIFFNWFAAAPYYFKIFRHS